MKETIDKLMALLDIALDQAYSDGRQELNHRSDATDDAVTQLRTALEQAMAVKPVEAERKAAAEHHLEVMRKALAAKPVESQTPTKYQVLAITTAYEQGVGKGRQAHALKSEIADPYGACWNLDYAWKLGYEEGKQQAERMDAAKPGEVEQIGHYAGEHKDGADLVSLYRDIPKGTPLFTAPPARVDGWQPIETAPKDQVILLGLPVAGNLHEDDRRVYEGRWHEAQQAWTSVNGFILFTGATHWMPLPPVPQSAKD